MSQAEQESRPPDPPESVDRDAIVEEEEEDARTPFDNPWLLPVLLWAFALWALRDGWFNPEMEWVKFNRGLFAVCALGGLWTTIGALRERRRLREAGSDGESATPR
jgi:hypothetical protein